MATAEPRAYPLRVSAQRDVTLSRWRWLVKWVLAIPHFVILVFLWLAFVVLTAVAGVAILLTGRYPASIFEFNVGVLRWTWRVQHYSYGALGTDRYPPFTLADVPDYPAHLDIERPEHLSRGLVLVKWWLLAIPHYLIVALFIGGLGPAFGTEEPLRWVIGGLVGVLVLAAGIVLAFTGKYPGPVYDVAVGMDRWVLRVAAYAGLMTDVYPPFRLDTGGPDPGDQPAVPVGGSPADDSAVLPPSAAAATPAAYRAWTPLRVVAVVAGAVLTLAATGVLAVGGVMLWADRTQRSEGLLMTPTRHYDTATHALISEHIDLPDADLGPFGPDSLLGTVRLELAPGDGSARFVGVAPTDQVEAYLDGVSYATVKDLAGDRAPVVTTGDRLPADPAQAGIWVASSSGSTPLTLTWDSRGGDWTVVVMRLDASAGFDASIRVGAEVPALPWIAGGTLGVGGLLLVGGIVLMVVPVSRASRGPRPPAPWPAQGQPLGVG